MVGNWDFIKCGEKLLESLNRACSLIRDYSGFCEEARQLRENYSNESEGCFNNPVKR